MGAFRTPTREAWEAAARKALKDRPLEELTRRDPDGLAIALLYTADDGGEALCAPRAADADGRAWDLRMAVEADSPAEANAEALADLQNGAASLLLSGAVLADPDPLIAALQGVRISQH
ncbi:MAG: methylmalonyl-CoA mutase, partial [Brevundimonas sp.]